MSSRFLFKGIQDDVLEKEANLRLSRLMDGAPYDATCAALLEKNADRYWASVDIYSTHGPFVARAAAPSAREALDRALVKIGERLDRWRAKRFNQRERAPLAPDVGVA